MIWDFPTGIGIGFIICAGYVVLIHILRGYLRRGDYQTKPHKPKRRHQREMPLRKIHIGFLSKSDFAKARRR
jgi:hypothetical protein